MSNFKDIFQVILLKHNLNWCRGCDEYRGHKRGFVIHSDRFTVHYDSKIATRKTLHNGLHEIGHCVNDERGLRNYECEANAEKFATDTMRKFGIRVPRKSVQLGKRYVARKKRHGDRIRMARNG